MKIRLRTALLAVATVGGMSVALADLKATAPKNVDLTALWKINDELSDDPRQAVARKRDEATDAGGRSGRSGRPSTGIDIGNIDIDIFGGGTVSGGVGGGGGGRRGGGGGGTGRDSETTPPDNVRVPLDAFLATREEFEIEHRPNAMTIRTIDETSTCKPGQTTQVPVPSGALADQTCGWQGSAFVVELKAPDGERRINRYELRKNAQQLVMISEIKGGHGQLAGLQIKRVYDRLVSPTL